MLGRPSLYDYYWGALVPYSLPHNISTNGSCSDINKYPDWGDKCYFAQNNDECTDVDGFINYVSFIYCTLGSSLFPLTVTLLVFWLFLLFIGLAVSADDYFCPAIEIISKVLRLSQNIAGVTIMALGNGAPDIFSSLAGIGQDRPALVFGELFGAGVFVTTVVAGAVAVTKPFKLMERPFLRDVSFYLMSGFWAFYIFWNQEIRLVDSMGFLVLYLVYILVVVFGRYINNKIRGQQVPYETQKDDDSGDSDEVPPPTTDGLPQVHLLPEPLAGINITKGLLAAMNPIDLDVWQDNNWFWRLYQMLKAPVDILFRLTIPVVDKDQPLDNWCQPLALLQCVMAPVFSVFATAVAIDHLGTSSLQVWHVSLMVGLVLGLAVFLTSRSTCPPPYHVIFAVIGFITSIIWIYVIANEVVSLLKAFGVMFNLSDAILGLTVLAWGNSIGDLIADTAMAKRGSPRAGFSACFGGPLFNLLLGIGLPFSYQILFKTPSFSPIILQFDLMTLALSLGLGTSLVFSFLILPFVTRFHAGKFYGIALLVIYAIFLGACIVLEFTVIEK